LYRIAANNMVDRWKRRLREGTVPEGELPEAAATDDIERRAVLFELVNALPAEQRRVVMLRFVEEKSIRDISQELKKTEGAVKQLQFRALKQLRSQMEGAHA
jgi:RNA polymerase sigma-70 factor (ECF subfamily)